MQWLEIGVASGGVFSEGLWKFGGGMFPMTGLLGLALVHVCTCGINPLPSYILYHVEFCAHSNNPCRCSSFGSIIFCCALETYRIYIYIYIRGPSETKQNSLKARGVRGHAPRPQFLLEPTIKMVPSGTYLDIFRACNFNCFSKVQTAHY